MSVVSTSIRSGKDYYRDNSKSKRQQDDEDCKSALAVQSVEKGTVPYDLDIEISEQDDEYQTSSSEDKGDFNNIEINPGEAGNGLDLEWDILREVSNIMGLNYGRKETKKNNVRENSTSRILKQHTLSHSLVRMITNDGRTNYTGGTDGGKKKGLFESYGRNGYRKCDSLMPMEIENPFWDAASASGAGPKDSTRLMNQLTIFEKARHSKTTKNSPQNQFVSEKNLKSSPT
jgi:hypothetical protein